MGFGASVRGTLSNPIVIFVFIGLSIFISLFVWKQMSRGKEGFKGKGDKGTLATITVIAFILAVIFVLFILYSG